MATALGFGGGLMAFSLSVNIYTFLVVLLFVNACAMAVDTLYKTLMQDLVPDEERGRAMGTWVLSVGFAPVGHVGVGALAGFVGAPGGPPHQRRGPRGHQRRRHAGRPADTAHGVTPPDAGAG